jgi:hypothetical protein
MRQIADDKVLRGWRRTTNLSNIKLHSSTSGLLFFLIHWARLAKPWL